MPRRPRTQPPTPPPDDAESLFAELLDDDIGVSDGEAGEADHLANAGNSGIPPAIAYQTPSAAQAPETALGDPDLPYWLALNRVRGIGPARFQLLLEGFGSARGAWEVGPLDWQAAGLDARSVAALEQQRQRIEPEAEVERLVKLRVGALRTIDPAYPRLLQEIPLPPPVLYVRGSLSPADEWALAIVGTRRASAYGKQMTEKLAGELARQSITVVSGLARGIDTAAHHAALAAGGRTIAVLGCGPDLVYPPENAKLAARIVEQGAMLTLLPHQPGSAGGAFSCL